LAFVIAKLAGAINWSWLVVFSPVLIYMALGAVITICVLLVVGVGILIGFKKLKNFLKSQGSTEYTESQHKFIDTGNSSVMMDGTSQSESKKVKLYEERGETSRYIDAEITKDGDLVMMGQDLGKLPQEYWGDSDYEFWVYVPAKHKDDVHRVLLEKFHADNPNVVNQFENLGSTDDIILALLEKLYTGNPKAVDQFKDFMRSQGIPAEFDSWA
jgi:tRNA(Leu) C34 or U34 (ribose-2'-O)-methylase TrmL